MEVSRGTDILVGPALDLGPPVKLVSRWSSELVFTSKLDDRAAEQRGLGCWQMVGGGSYGGERLSRGTHAHYLFADTMVAVDRARESDRMDHL